MKKTLLIFTITCLSIGFAKAQYAEDAIRFSNTTIGGTARVLGFAGAQTAIGGDLGNFAGNPAGLGFYRRSDFSFSPTFRFNTTESSGLGKLSTEQKNNFNIGNLGFVITNLNQDYTGREVVNGWVSYSFGLTMNRINNFHQNRFFTGTNPSSSISQYFAENANSIPGYIPDTLVSSLEDMAWFGYLLNYDTVNNRYTPVSTGNVNQKQKDLIKGSQNEWTFAFGANYSNKLYLGASLGIGSLSYTRETQFVESAISDPENNVTSLTLNETHRLSGSSVNLKVGAIYRPVDLVRFGVSIQTPNFYRIDENFKTDLSSIRNNSTVSTFTPLEYILQYSLNTPYRYNGGVALFFGKLGFITADAEYVNYSQARVRTELDDFNFGDNNNADINRLFTNTLNLRLGAEARLGDIALRAGVANYGDTYKSAAIDDSRMLLTAGIGYRAEDYYIDFAFVNSSYKSVYSPYFLANGSQPTINNKINTNSLVITFGTRF